MQATTGKSFQIIDAFRELELQLNASLINTPEQSRNFKYTQSINNMINSKSPGSRNLFSVIPIVTGTMQAPSFNTSLSEY